MTKSLMYVLSGALILALLGALGLGAWVMILKSANADLRVDLTLSEIDVAAGNATILNVTKHKERQDAINDVPDSDLADAVDPSWMLPEASAD